jgi:hypothetical protein
VSDSLERLKPGLDTAEKLKPGSGWVAAEVRAESDVPLAVTVEGGMKLNPDWSAYGDVWVQPTQGKAGADAALRYKYSIDIDAGGAADRQGNWEAQAGVKWRF